MVVSASVLASVCNRSHHDGENTPTVSRQCKQGIIAIGRPDANFHRLRHSYATIAIELGDDLKTVQKTLGHATEGFTLKVYTHVTEKMKTQSAERMEAYIQKVSQ